MCPLLFFWLFLSLAFQPYLVWRETEILFLVLAATSLFWANSTPLRHVGHPIQADLLFLCFTLLHVFLQVEVLWQPVSSKSISTIFPTAFVHFVSLSHLGILAMCQSFSVFFYLLWRSVISDLWCYCWNLGCELHRPCPYKMANLMVNIVCSDCSTNQLLQSLSLSSGLSISWDKNIEIRLITLQWLLSVQVKESCISL